MLNTQTDILIIIGATALLTVTFGLGYTVGHHNGIVAQQEKQQAQIVKLQNDNLHLLKQRESELAELSYQSQAAIQELTIRNERLQDEIKRNVKQIDSTNHFTKQFSGLLNASAVRESSGPAYTRNDESASRCQASRLLSIMIDNNVNHQECVHQVRLWQDWYKLNFGDK